MGSTPIPILWMRKLRIGEFSKVTELGSVKLGLNLRSDLGVFGTLYAFSRWTFSNFLKSLGRGWSRSEPYLIVSGSVPQEDLLLLGDGSRPVVVHQLI